MLITDKNHINKGDVVFCVIDERPLANPYIERGTVTDVYDDHYLYRDELFDIDNIWGLYDNEEGDSILIFTQESEATDYLNKLQRRM